MKRIITVFPGLLLLLAITPLTAAEKPTCKELGAAFNMIVTNPLTKQNFSEVVGKALYANNLLTSKTGKTLTEQDAIEHIAKQSAYDPLHYSLFLIRDLTGSLKEQSCTYSNKPLVFEGTRISSD